MNTPTTASSENQYLGQQWMQKKIREQATLANLVGLVGALLGIACLLGIPDEQYWNIRIPLYIIVSIWTFVRPRTALYLLPLAIPWGSLDPIGGLSSADILVALLAMSWLLSYTIRPFISTRLKYRSALDYDEHAVPRSLIIAIAILLLTMLISMTVAISFLASVKELIKWLEVLIVLALGLQYLRTRRQIWILFLIICIAGVSQALLGYAQTFFKVGPSSFIRDDSLRVYGTFNQPNPYAGYINMILAPTIALLLLGRQLALRVCAGGIAIVLAGAEFYSQSKGGWIAIGVAIFIIILLGFPQLRPLLSIGIISILTLLCLYLMNFIAARYIDPILMKIGVIGISFTAPTPVNYANSERVAHWVAGLQMFQDYPFLGVGIGNYQYAYSDYSQGIFVTPLGHAHNYYINSAAEMGTLGLVVFVAFLIIFFRSGIRAYLRLNALYQETRNQIATAIHKTALERYNTLRHFSILVNDRALAIGLLAALVSVCVHNLVDNLYVHGMASLFALLLVLLIRLEGASAQYKT